MPFGNMLSLAVVLALGVTPAPPVPLVWVPGCSAWASDDSAVRELGPERPPDSTQAKLDPRIPAARPASYDGVQDAKDWRNPFLVIRPEGIEVISAAIPGGRQTVASDNLQELLARLSVSVWPYGRVVAISDVGLRGGAPDEESAIQRHRLAAEKILLLLDVRANWWPS